MAQLPQAPSYFLKPPSSLSGHREPVVRPHGCRLPHFGQRKALRGQSHSGALGRLHPRIGLHLGQKGGNLIILPHRGFKFCRTCR